MLEWNRTVLLLDLCGYHRIVALPTDYVIPFIRRNCPFVGKCDRDHTFLPILQIPWGRIEIMYKKNSGFNLVELMIVLLVAGVLFALAAPSFDSTSRNGNLTSSVNDMVSSLHLARTEATKRGVTVVVCRTSDANANAPACNTGNGSWQDGWLVFADDNDSGQIDGGEDLITVHDALGGSVIVKSHANLNDAISYQATGFAEFGAPALGASTEQFFVYCDDSADDKFSRVLLITNSGRPQIISRDVSYVTAPSCNT